MKTILFSLVFFTLSSCLSAQIAGDFEIWTTDPFGFQIPVGWTVNNAEPTRPVSVPNTTPYSGSLALQLFSEGPSFEGRAPGRAFRKFYTATNDPVTVQVRVDSIIPGGSAKVNVYNKNFTVLYGSWTGNAVTTDYVSVSVPLQGFAGADSLWIELVANTTLGPLGYDGYAIATFDALGQLTTSTNEPGFDHLHLYPNPTTGPVIFGNKRLTDIMVMDAGGRIVLQSTQAESIDLSHLPPGVYTLKALFNGEKMIARIVRSTN
jgi:hypothetical protein